MVISTDELELHTSIIEKFQQENPKTWAHILHNWDVIKNSLASGATATDLTALQTALTALQAELDALEIEVAAIDLTPFDPSALLAAIADLQDQIDAVVIPPFPPPFAMPDGLVDQVLTHGPGGNGDFFFADPAVGVIYAPAQTGDLIPVNEGTIDEAILPEFALDDDGRIMLIPVA